MSAITCILIDNKKYLFLVQSIKKYEILFKYITTTKFIKFLLNIIIDLKKILNYNYTKNICKIYSILTTIVLHIRPKYYLKLILKKHFKYVFIFI